MKCPYCDSNQYFVTNSRVSGNSVWRRRKCQKCLGLFTTMEKIVLGNLKILKKSCVSERYDRDKIYLGIYRAVSESKWISRDKERKITNSVTEEVEKQLICLKKDYISSKKIGNIVLKELKIVSKEGYLRFLAFFMKPGL